MSVRFKSSAKVRNSRYSLSRQVCHRIGFSVRICQLLLARSSYATAIKRRGSPSSRKPRTLAVIRMSDSPGGRAVACPLPGPRRAPTGTRDDERGQATAVDGGDFLGERRTPLATDRRRRRGHAPSCSVPPQGTVIMPKASQVPEFTSADVLAAWGRPKVATGSGRSTGRTSSHDGP